MHLDVKTRNIYVAGHRGLVGSAVVKHLQASGYTNLILRSRSEVDLRDQSAVNTFFNQEKPEFVVMAAARVGGIMANNQYPVDFISDNLAIQTNVIRAAHDHGVKRLLFLGSSCIYPKMALQPLREDYLLTGPLEPTNQWYAIAKIAGLKMCEAYHRQYGDDFISVMPTNLYGPDDNFDLKKSHVLPALIRKFHEAKGRNGQPDRPVVLWGTGTPRREFLISSDLADACLFLLKVPESEFWAIAPDGLINIGVGKDLELNELAYMIRDIVGSQSAIEHDLTKPDGTPRKLMDVQRLHSLGWKAKTPLREGIRQAYHWFLENYESL